MARQFFKKHHIRYQKKDIQRSVGYQREFVRLGGRGIPLILIGKKRIYGYNSQNMTRVLRRSGYSI